ncbi:unnamed protein product [Parajaminaea phylloscopi]
MPAKGSKAKARAAAQKAAAAVNDTQDAGKDADQSTTQSQGDEAHGSGDETETETDGFEDAEGGDEEASHSEAPSASEPASASEPPPQPPLQSQSATEARGVSAGAGEPSESEPPKGQDGGAGTATAQDTPDTQSDADGLKDTAEASPKLRAAGPDEPPQMSATAGHDQSAAHGRHSPAPESHTPAADLPSSDPPTLKETSPVIATQSDDAQPLSSPSSANIMAGGDVSRSPTSSPLSQQQVPPVPPRVKTDSSAPPPASPATDARKRSQSSLWDRLRSPVDRAASTSAAVAEPPASGGPPLPPRRPSYKPTPSSFLNSITSAANFAATSAASRGFSLPERLGGGAAAAASLAPTPTERKRVPRHEVDEAKMMEDQMRFAEARHILATSRDTESIRSIGKDLEAGWRNKLAEVTELHVKLEDLAASVADVQDENEQLRVQLASLSEQIALREEDFEGFQRLTVAHQQRERELWQQEGLEEKERLEWKEREAVRILAEERAINAQLRLVLFGSLKDQAHAARSGAALTGLTGQSRWSLLATTGGDGTVTPPGRSDRSRRETASTSAIFDNVSEYDSSSPTQELSRGPRPGSHGAADANAGDAEDRVQDDVLFNLNLPHAAGQAAHSSHQTGSTSTHPIASLVTDVVPLDQLKLLLRLDGSTSEEQLSAVLPSVVSGSNGTASTHESSALSSRGESIDYHSTTDRSGSPAATSPATTTESVYSTHGSKAAAEGSLTDSAASGLGQISLAHLESHLLAAKSIADFQLSQTLQLENLSLRSRLKDEQRNTAALEQEIVLLREKVQGMEEAVSGLLEDQSQPQPMPLPVTSSPEHRASRSGPTAATTSSPTASREGIAESTTTTTAATADH